jgi:hypothetical protein
MNKTIYIRKSLTKENIHSLIKINRLLNEALNSSFK